MRRQIKLLGFSLILIATFTFIVSCNSGADDKKTVESTVADTSKKAPETSQEQPKAKAMAIAGTLDYLYIEATDFMKLPKAKLVFSFTFQPTDILTLYGWSCKNNGLGNCTGSYNTAPNIKLKKYQPSTVAYGPDVFFGNVILQKDDVKDIKAKIASYDYVVFVPVNTGGFITYEINVTDDPPTAVKAFALNPTGVIANPSPPKDY